MIKSAAEIAIATQVVSLDKSYRRLKPVARELGQVSIGMMGLVITQHLSGKLKHRFYVPDAEEQDRRALANIKTVLQKGLADIDLSKVDEIDQLAELHYRLRIFLNDMDEFTGWKRDHVS